MLIKDKFLLTFFFFFSFLILSNIEKYEKLFSHKIFHRKKKE